MTESVYKEYQNKYYNPNDNDKRPGDNDNWKSIQEGFHRIGSTQLETSEGLTVGAGGDNEETLSAAELKHIKKLINGMYKYVTPEMYGAIGNGITDDTQALQECIKSGNAVALKKKYRITSTLNFDYITDLILFGGGEITRDKDATFNTIRGRYCDNITIDNIVLDGNGNNRSTVYEWIDNVQAAVILASKSKRVTVRNCVIKNFNYGVFILGADIDESVVSFENTAYMGSIVNCVFYNCNSSIDTYGKGILIDHNIFYDITQNAIQIEANNNLDLSVENPLEDSMYYTSAYGCIVSNNLFIDVLNGTAIIIHGNSGGTHVINNTIINFAKGISTVTTLMRGCLIESNILINQKEVTIDANTRPWAYEAAITCSGELTKVVDNIIIDSNVGICTFGGASINGNIFYRPRISAYVQPQSVDITAPTIISNNIVRQFTQNVEAWWNSKALVFYDTDNTMLLNNFVETNVEPIGAVGDAKVFVDNLYTTVQQTSSVTNISGVVKYSNQQ